jgi:hypothetical protein
MASTPAEGDRTMKHSGPRARLAVLAVSAGLALAACAQAQGGAAPSSPTLNAAPPTPSTSTAVPAGGVTLDPSLRAELNEIGNQITEVDGDLQSARPSPEGDPSQ